MRQTLVLLKFVVALSFVAGFSVNAQTPAPSVGEREALSWLKKIQSAAQKLNYSGTFIYQQADQMRTTRIAHLFNGKNEIEKLEILDGQAREYIRKNDEVICYVPEARTLVVERRATPDSFPALLATNLSDVQNFYSIRMAETGRVAGFDCQAIVLEPKDNLRYGYKLWAEKSSGLLLRAQTLNDRQETVEQIAFTQVSIGNVDSGKLKPSITNTKGWHVENASMRSVDLSAWEVKGLPPGFRKVQEVKRLVSELDDKTAHGTATLKQREVSQIVFSDGLAAISVFIEPESQSRTEGFLQRGALNIVGKRQGDFWLTIVGEVPAAAIRQVANSIELKSNNQQ